MEPAKCSTETYSRRRFELSQSVGQQPSFNRLLHQTFRGPSLSKLDCELAVQYRHHWGLATLPFRSIRGSPIWILPGSSPLPPLRGVANGRNRPIRRWFAVRLRTSKVKVCYQLHL